MGKAYRHGWHAEAGLSMQAVLLFHLPAETAEMADINFKSFHANFVCYAGITVNMSMFIALFDCHNGNLFVLVLYDFKQSIIKYPK